MGGGQSASGNLLSLRLASLRGHLSSPATHGIRQPSVRTRTLCPNTETISLCTMGAALDWGTALTGWRDRPVRGAECQWDGPGPNRPKPPHQHALTGESQGAKRSIQPSGALI